MQPSGLACLQEYLPAGATVPVGQAQWKCLCFALHKDPGSVFGEVHSLTLREAIADQCGQY